MATAVRLGRYLDVEITLVHGRGMVMPGFRVRCHPIEAFDSEPGGHHSVDARMRSSVRRPILLIVGLLSA